MVPPWFTADGPDEVAGAIVAALPLVRR
jgi:hypothetical protein